MKILQLGLVFALCTLSACSSDSDNNNSDFMEEITGQWFMPCNVLNGRIGTETITFQNNIILSEHQYYSDGTCTNPASIYSTAERETPYTFGEELTTSEGLSAVEINLDIKWSDSFSYTEKNIVSIANNKLYFGQFESEEDCDPDELIDPVPTIRPFCNERPTRLDFDREYQRVE